MAESFMRFAVDPALHVLFHAMPMHDTLKMPKWENLSVILLLLMNLPTPSRQVSDSTRLPLLYSRPKP